MKMIFNKNLPKDHEMYNLARNDELGNIVVNLKDVLIVNKWLSSDELTITYDELEGKKRIIITREANNG